MAVTFVAAGTQGVGTGSVTPGMPAGATTGDLLILVIEGEGEDANADNPPTGGAWNTIGSVASATDGAVDRTRCSVYWAWYDAGINRTVPDAGNHTVAMIFAFRGVDATTPLDGVTPASGSRSTNSTSQSAATGISSATDGAMAILAFSHGDDGVTISSLANANLASANHADTAQSSSGSDGTAGLHYGIRTSAGAIGTWSWGSGASEELAWWAFVLRPSSGPTQYEESVAGTVTPSGVVTTSTSAAPRSFAGAFTPSGELTAAAVPLRTGVVKLSFAAGSGPTENMDTVGLHIHHGSPDVGSEDLDLKFWLYQGMTLIESGTLTVPNNTISYQTVSLVSSTQITNWADLEIWFQAINNTPGGTAEVRIYETWLSYPYVAGPTVFTADVAGALAPAGADPVLLAATSPDAALTPAAVVSRSTSTTVTGAVSSAGAVAKTGASSLVGAIASAGSLRPFVAKQLAAVITTAGTVVRQTAHRLTAAVASAGDVATEALGGVASLLLEGTLATAGQVSKLVDRTVSGVVSSAGAAIRQTAVSLAAAITSAGSVATEVISGLVTLLLEGAVSAAGTVSRFTSKTLTGAVASAGSLVTQAIGVIVELALSGALSLAGTVRKLTATATTGALSPAAQRVHSVLQQIAGSVASAGNLVAQSIGGLVQLVLGGSVTPSAVVTRHTATSFAATLTPVAEVYPTLLGTPTTGTVVLEYAPSFGSTSTMANSIWHVRFGTAAAAPNTTLYLTLKEGGTTIASFSEDDFTDGSIHVLAFDLSSQTQITDWSNLRLEAYAEADPADAVPVRIYDTWIRHPSAGGFMIELEGYLLFGPRGAWPDWDNAWEGGVLAGSWPSWDDAWLGTPLPKITKEVHTSTGGVLTTAGLMLDEGKILVFTGILTFIGDLTTRIFGKRHPAGSARPRPRSTIDVDAAEARVAPAADGTTVDPDDFASRPHPVDRRGDVEVNSGTQVDPE